MFHYVVQRLMVMMDDEIYTENLAYQIITKRKNTQRAKHYRAVRQDHNFGEICNWQWTNAIAHADYYYILKVQNCACVGATRPMVCNAPRQHRTGSTNKQVAALPVRLIFAIVSACGLHYRPFGHQLGLRLSSRPAVAIFGLRPQFSTFWASTRFRFLSSIMGTSLGFSIADVWA